MILKSDTINIGPQALVVYEIYISGAGKYLLLETT